MVDEVVGANPGQAAEYRAGKDALLGFFVGQVMRSTGGRAEPRTVQELLREALARVVVRALRATLTTTS